MTTDSDQKNTPPVKRSPGLIASAFISLVVSLLTSTAVVMVYDQRYAQKIVTIDLKGYIRSQRDKAVSNEVSDEDLRRNIDAMEAALLAEPVNHTVLLKDVVLRNGREIKP